MLSYFRVNDPYRLVGLLIVTIFLYLALLSDLPPLTTFELKTFLIGDKLLSGSSMYSEVIDSCAPLTSWFYKAFTFLFGESTRARHIVALVIVFLQATYIGIVFIDKKAFPENSFLPSLIFIVLYVFAFDSLTLSGDLFALTFLLIALHNLLKEIEFREESLTAALNIGFFIGIASLFELSFSVYVPAALVILLMFTRSSARKFSLLTFGFLMPHLLIIGIYFIRGNLGYLWEYFYWPNLSFSSQAYVSFSSAWHLLLVPAVFTIISLIFLNRESRFTKYQSQLLQALFFWFVFSIFQVLYAKEFRPQTFISLIPVMAFYISHLLLTIRRRRFAEMTFWLFIASMIAGSYYFRYEDVVSPSYERYVIHSNPSTNNQRILVLSDDIRRYQGKKLATPFLNWALSREIFEHPEYFENIDKIYTGFSADPPQVVYDPEGRMGAILKRAPRLSKMYSKINNNEYLLNIKK